MISQIRGDELDGADTHECKLKQLPIWDLRLASKWKQLDAHQKQNIVGVPCSDPPGATVSRSHWNYIIRSCMCSDGSKRVAPELRFAQTDASCIDQPCIRLLFALSTAKRTAPELRFAQTYASCIDQPSVRLLFALSTTKRVAPELRFAQTYASCIDQR
jgi:hypothetical protein